MSVEDDQRMEGEGNQQTSTGSSKRYNCQPSTKNTMSDIAGIDIVREEMNELISYLRDYEKYSKPQTLNPKPQTLNPKP